MSEKAAVLAGMEMLVWDVSREQWNESLALRRAFLRARSDDDGLLQREWDRHDRLRNQARPDRVLFTSTGLMLGVRAFRWRSRWWRLDRIRITRAGWELLELRWRFLWRITHRELLIPMPPDVRSHVADMAELLAERLPGQADVEHIVEPGNEDGAWFAR